MLDYRTLPFISSQSAVPRVAAARTGRSRLKACRAATSSSPSTAGAARRSTRPGTSVWPLPDEVFQRMVESREPFWATRRARRPARSASTSSTTAAASTRSAIRSITWFGHLINLAELVMLAARALPRAARPARRSSARSTLADAGERPRAAARDPLQLLPQAVPRVRAPAPSCRCSSWRSPRAPTSRRSSAPASRKRRRGRRPSRSGWSKTTRRCSSAAPAALDADRRSDHGARPPRDRPGRQPVRPRAPAGDERARPVRVAAAADAHAGRRLPRASCSTGCRPSSATRRSATSPTGSPPRRSAPAAARGSSPCR